MVTKIVLSACRPLFLASIFGAVYLACHGNLSTAYCEPKLPPLEVGQNFNDVIRLWGAPQDKEEHESKRIDIWRYGKAQVTFHEGRVSYWHDTESGLSATTVSTGKSVENTAAIDNSSVSGDKGPGSAVVEEILAEIMKEPPSNEPAAEPTVLAAPMPGQAIIQPPVSLPPAEIIN